MDSNQKTKRIVILGGGFAGVYTARALEKIWGKSADVQIRLVSRENYFLMTPFLFEAGSGVLDPRHVVSPIRRMLEQTQFIAATVESIDLEKRIVTTRSSAETRTLEYDHLVLALGGITNTQVISGSDSAMQFKSLFDAIQLRNQCIRMFEEADVETNDEVKKSLLRFAIIGGGLVGVELQGELTEFVENIRSAYPRVKKEDCTFHLIQAGPRLVPEIDEDLGVYANKTLTGRGVNVHLNTPVERIEGETIHLKGGAILTAKTIVLAAGVATNPLVAALPIEKDKHGRTMVEATMRSKSRPEVWALGDCASIPDPQGKPYPQLAQHALREARLLAKNISAAIRGGELKPFIYNSKGTLAALGRHRGVGRVYWFKVYGFIAWWVWRTYYLMQMPHFQRKLRVVIDWTVALFFKNDVVELDMRKTPS